MAVIVKTTAPSDLLEMIKEQIRKGKIETWSVDSDGDFTHVPSQWANKAWFRPKVEQDRIVFRILNPKGPQMTGTIYAVYHGRFIEMLLNHFDTEFDDARATALPALGDIIGSAV